jgi:hypothetical protein
MSFMLVGSLRVMPGGTLEFAKENCSILVEYWDFVTNGFTC